MRLVEEIQAGVERERNFQRLFDMHWSRVVSYFRWKGFSEDKSEDLTQDTFLRVFKGIDSFRRESTFEWWLLEAAKSTFKNELRRKTAEKRDGVEQSLDIPISNESSPSLIETLVSPAPGALEGAMNREQVTALRAALNNLPPQMRQCCILRYVKGLKYQEIADLMQISIETVKAHLFQGRKRLASMLGTTEEAAKKRDEDAT
jgi:RNA polymerase sigma-70 factor (ECF subfamily)